MIEFIKEVFGEDVSTTLIFILGLLIAIVGFLFKNKKKVIRLIMPKQKYYKKLTQVYKNEKAVKEYVKLYVTTKFQSSNPEENTLHNIINARENLYDKLLSEIKGKAKYFYILGGSGFGKTTFLINFFIKYNMQLFTGKKYPIEILSFKNFEEEIKNIKIKNKNKLHEIILLVDAFDENESILKKFDNLKKADRDIMIFNKVINEIKDFYKVIVTARTQLFKNIQDEPHKIRLRNPLDKSIYTFHKFYISPFDDDDVKAYINKKYPSSVVMQKNRQRKKQALELIERCKNTDRYTDIFFRPMLLAEIDGLINIEALYDYEIFTYLLDKWLDREILNESESRSMKKLSYMITKDIYLGRYQAYLDSGSYSELYSSNYEKLANTLTTKIPLSKIRGRSLLNRDDQGRYKFAHSVFFELLLVDEIFKNKETDLAINFDYNFQLLPWAKLFYFEYIFKYYLDEKLNAELRTKFNSQPKTIKFNIKERIFNNFKDKSLKNDFSKDKFFLIDVHFSQELNRY